MTQGIGKENRNKEISLCMYCSTPLCECKWLLNQEISEGMEIKSYKVSNGNKMQPVHRVVRCRKYTDDFLENLEKIEYETIAGYHNLSLIIGAPEATIEKWVNRYGLPRTKIKSKSYFNVIEVRKWLKNRHGGGNI